MVLLIIASPFIFGFILTFLMMYFTDNAFLPYKRKMEKMLHEIQSWQNKLNATQIVFYHKGKEFIVSVQGRANIYGYGKYTVHINGNHVMTWHVLTHLCSKSRFEEHHGDMLQSEEFEIIKAAYKYAKKKNDEYWTEKLNKPSYFN